MLRRKLFYGMFPLLAILLVLGCTAVVLFQKLGGAVDVILRENYASIVACQQMNEAIAGLDTACLFSLQGDENRAREIEIANKQLFETNLNVELHNITLPGEQEAADDLKTKYLAYMDQLDQFTHLAVGTAGRREFYLSKLMPGFHEIHQASDKILELNQNNMFAANQAARSLSAESSRKMVEAMILAVAMGWLAVYWVSHHLLKPITALTQSSEAMGRGDLDQLVPVATKDELGQLAETFNHMASKLRANRQLSTEQLSRAQKTVELALAAFPDPIFVYSLSGNIELSNPAAQTFLKEIGSHLPEIFSKLVDEVLKSGKEYLPMGFDQAVPVQLLRQERYFLPRALAMRDDQGALFGVVLALQDVTRLRLADDVKTNLISTVSHELKTPLTSVQMAIYVLLEERIGALTPKQLELLVTARQNSDRLLQLIDDLLDVARFEEGDHFLDLRPTPPEKLIGEARVLAEEHCREKGLILEIETEADLPVVDVSSEQMNHVFANLLSNAARYSPVGGKLTLGARKEQEKGVCFYVQDEGPGVPTEFQKRVFEKFFRIDKGRQGVGLGLAISREIVHAHGGRIGMKNLEGHGSEFFFVIPSRFNSEGASVHTLV